MPGAPVALRERLDQSEAALDGLERPLELAAPVLVVDRELAPALHLAGFARGGPELGGALVLPRPLGAPREPRLHENDA